MEKSEHKSETSNERSVNMLSLPVEVLVYIISFLPTAHDIVKLQYVSKRLRDICETPSLWNNFVWPLYGRREERAVINVLKTCGQHIKIFNFPDYVAPSKLLRMMGHCRHVTHLILPSEPELHPESISTTVQHMES